MNGGVQRGDVVEHDTAGDVKIVDFVESIDSVSATSVDRHLQVKFTTVLEGPVSHHKMYTATRDEFFEQVELNSG